ncbi:aerobic respiration two-component sensor histidine kinase ArcB [Alginatibacterium sediminis]|uniref:Aerobic respiration control sensor protein n=1 Tax=Alginatibacterium sediminis TaxID=2164068 RepID=A0A420E8Q6_9ALTE|nr:aerobic respiration two-component sensor histidine kinase ArcB [Alginatibacterium sediminis]RKF15815.1 aerobic respiration two-component sensor histidine kinase ArcB [Alginatibacterium sediminis]
MTPLKKLATYYVHLLSHLGIVRFSISLATAIICVALLIQMAVTFVLTGSVSEVDLIRSIFFALVLTPWAVYFMSVVVEQLEDSRMRLTEMVRKLEQMRSRDQELTQTLQQNINQLNSEIAEREKAEAARQHAIKELESEVIQRERAQVELEERSVLLRSFIDSSPDLVYYRNEQGQFSGCNRAMEELTGKKERELIGLTPFDVYEQEIASLVVETDSEVFAQNEPLTYEQWLQYPDGRKAFYELRKVPFYSNEGSRLGLLGFGRDLTERKFQQEKLEQASRDKTQFVSTLSHELRTPLNGVVGLSRILLDTKLDSSQRKHVNTILLSASTLGNIFNDIIDLDKLDRRRFTIANDVMDFSAFLVDIETLTQLQAQQKGLQFDLKCSGPMPEFVIADPTRLRQVLWNLTQNAIKFTEHGFVTLSVTASAGSNNENVNIRFDVEDSGVGIEHEQMEQIFAMYYQVEGQRKANGTGIGLAVTKQLVEAMEGQIYVRSELGKGSCFSVTLDLKRSQSEQREIEIDHPPLEILLVEDVELNVTIATALLENMGHVVHVAMTGQEAIDMFEPDDFDLVLLDIQLPDMTGFEVSSYLFDHHPASLMPPIVALTANVVSKPDEYKAVGMQDILHKPIDKRSVIRCFNSLFGLEPSEPTFIASQKPVSNAHIDMDLLQQHWQTMGKDLLLRNIELFAKVMPDYIAIIDSNLIAQDMDALVEEAHKVKGAAGSIGLAHIQRLANSIQSPELPAWKENMPDWIAQMKADYPSDLAELTQLVQSMDQ